MSIVGRSPTTPIKETRTVSLDQSGYKSVAADHTDIRLQSIQAYLDGMPWTTEAYYSQYLRQDNQIREIDVQLSPAHQQYKEIKSAELRVQSSNQSSFNSEEKTVTTTGSAILLHVVPNEFDYFVAGAGFKRMGLYRVKTVERRIVDDAAVYLIDYELDSYIDESNTKHQNLLAKVVQRYTFSRDRLIEGISPVIKTKDLEDLVNLQVVYERLLRDFHRDFFDRHTGLIGAPGQSSKVYDHRHMKFLTATAGLGDHNLFLNVKSVSFDNERYMGAANFWSVLLDRDFDAIDTVVRDYSLVPKKSFWKNSWLRGPVFWPVDYYVYPSLQDDLVFEHYNDNERIGVASLKRSFEDHYDSPAGSGHLGGLYGTDPIPSHFMQAWNIFSIDDEDVCIIKPACYDGSYVFSLAFYEKSDDLSVLEILTRDYMRSRSLNLNQLHAVVSSIKNWPLLEKFYYTPIILVLIKEAQARFSR